MPSLDRPPVAHGLQAGEGDHHDLGVGEILPRVPSMASPHDDGRSVRSRAIFHILAGSPECPLLVNFDLDCFQTTGFLVFLRLLAVLHLALPS